MNKVLKNMFQVELNERSTRQIFITNTGNFNIDFNWLLTGPSKPRDQKTTWTNSNLPITINPDASNIPTNCKRRCLLVFSPPCKMALKNCNLALKVRNVIAKLSKPLYTPCTVGKK